MRYFFLCIFLFSNQKTLLFFLFTNELDGSLTYCELLAEHQQETESVDGDREGEKYRHYHGTVKN